MSNLDTRPEAVECGDGDPVDRIEVLTPRDVPLGGVRAMTVRRTLPQRARSFIGAWCFLDHYGPDDVAVTGGMRVPPHPHTGLQTVSWLFSGEIEHRDSLGTRAVVRPGELNLMTAGHGISHSEDSTDATRVLHGVQLWTVLPERHRGTAPAFDHHVPAPVPLDDGVVRVFLGSLAGSTSPVPTFSPLVGAEIVLGGEYAHTFAVDPRFEHGVLVDTGTVEVAGTRGDADQLLYVPPGADTLTLRAVGGDVRLVLIGGLPLGERIVMWWNFIGRDHDEVIAARRQWQAQIGADDAEVTAAGDPAGGDTTRADLAAPDGVPDAAVPPGPTAPTPADARFGSVTGHPHPPLPAPPLPNHRLKPRG
ncbi:pirin family protein [Cellulomonas sp. ATA003]|uniref:pirin family protein n=1 Tax=Cellulomonas sp. ATA003 TaxID=3073064 RepID=UPI002873C7B5|nr:pirin family protein [Cellulomonas sp. ATA003]WNB86910.1 pirin family protein [Cellulomonas sp. ATA003]